MPRGEKTREVNIRLGRIPPSRKGKHHTIKNGDRVKMRRSYEEQYKITQEKVIARQEKLAGRKKTEDCEICGAMGVICFDHDHQTGKFRGWLCRRCNLVLGMVKDNMELLDAMIKYLEK